MIAATAIVHPEVRLGESAVVEDYCILGARYSGYRGEQTVIGANAVIRSHTVIYGGNLIGRNFQSGNKANVRELNVIGDDVSIGTLAVVEHHVTIEDCVRIHSQAFIPEFCVLRRGAWIGPQVALTNAKYPKHPDAKNNLQGVVVGENARIGAGAVLLPGVSIGAGALVGAGSVVTKDVPDGMVVAGSPARVIRPVHY